MPPKKRAVKRRKIPSSLTILKPDGSVTKKPLDYFSLSVTSKASKGADDSHSGDLNIPSSTSSDHYEHTEVPEGTQAKSRKEKETQAWQQIRQKLHCAFLKSVVPSSDRCQGCKSLPSSLVMCYDCTSTPVMCSQCTVDHHSENHQFHNLVTFKDGTQSKFSFVKELKVSRHMCDQKYEKSMDLFDRQGAIHSCEVTFCRCETEMESLVRCGFWPSSPKEPTCAISIQLLEWIHAFLLETKSSLKSICQALKWHHRVSEENISYLYSILTRETCEEFRRFHRKASSTPFEQSGLDDESSCTACPTCGFTQAMEQFFEMLSKQGLTKKLNHVLGN